MTRDIAFLVILFPLVSIAGENTYLCTIKQILELSESGMMGKHTGAYKQLVDKQFSINRNTGEMVGLPFSTQYYKQITVLDKGSSDNSYKAIVTSYPPNMWVLYIYVAEHNPGKKKPFWGTDDGDKIFSGYCE
jgi:hypothetical protein